MPTRSTLDPTTLDLAPFADEGLTGERLDALLEEHEARTAPALARLWSYYRNPASARPVDAIVQAAGSARSLRPYRLAQERGLPERLRAGAGGAGATEVVIENDIAWRIEAMVDFVFGKPLRIASTAPDEGTRRDIEAMLDALWESSGGISLLQDMGLLGAVYGQADLVLRTDEMFDSARRSGGAGGIDRALESVRRMRIELVEAQRAIPILDPGDYRRIAAYIIRVGVEGASTSPSAEADSLLGRVLDRIAGRRRSATSGAAEASLEIISAGHRQVYLGGRLALDRVNEMGALPVVHIQNSSQPYQYEGLSDVEPLIPMQDELNTRLSDRAHRVTLQSFNMYLAKGLDALQQPGLRVAPGQVWLTDNTEASVQAFGGDGASPSEDAHIEQIRDAMDKISGVSPVAIGVIRARLGHLSSENALRITLMGVLSKTARKRVAYGRGIAEISRLALRALDIAGVYRTSERDRGVRIEWPDPLPTDERSRLAGALMKRDLGVPLDRVLGELGYAPVDAGVQ
jgi:hypothetical protein